MYMKLSQLTKEEIETLFIEHKNINRILRHLNLNSNGSGNYRTFKQHCYNLGIKIPEHKCKGTCGFNNPKKPIEFLLKENSDCSKHNLKRRLLNENILENKCHICGITEWNGKKLSLHLDHINGVNNDNRLENLRILCPNCHSQTETYSGKNLRKKHYCACGLERHKESSICIKCSKKKQRKVERPPYNQLVEEVSKFGYSAIGRKYCVSDNGIRKWIKIPY